MSDQTSPTQTSDVILDVDRLKDEIQTEATRRLELSNAIVESLPDGLVVVDEQGMIVLVNSQTEIMFGYHRTQMIGQSLNILLPESIRDKHFGHRSRYMREPRVRAMGAGLKLSGRRSSGAEFPLEIMLSPVVTTEGPYVIAVVRRVALNEC